MSHLGIGKLRVKHATPRFAMTDIRLRTPSLRREAPVGGSMLRKIKGTNRAI